MTVVILCANTCKCLCDCNDNCRCSVLCSGKLCTVSEYMEKSKQILSSSPSSSEEDSTGFLTDSDFEGYISRKPRVLSSDDSSD